MGKIEAYIVGGKESVDRRSTVAIQSAGGTCSGTVIGPHTVLTAAHCGQITDVLVVAVAWFDVTEVIIHPDYSFPSFDLNIVHTLQELPEPYAVLATPEVDCYATVAQGYGVGSEGQLNEREVFESGRFDDQILASTAIAPGDSGGPLWAITDDGPVLLGVASWGVGGAPDYIGGTGFISVPEHITWIQENIR